ncbi:TonB-dependent receptor, partial [candidate division KSB1 bacterium]|nr:TonB-dependent receptor [candidate division KSB1 bacterium]
MRKKFLNITLFVFLFFAKGYPADRPLGKIEGKLVDGDTKAPLVGGNVLIMNTTMGSATDAGGYFKISNVPVGNYSVKFSYIGYDSYIQTDVIVKTKRTTVVTAQLKLTSLEMNEVTVTAGYFSEADDQPVSLVNFSYEEIRRAPGSAGDVSRIIYGLPSIAKVNDQTNNLIVRGGSPMENTFLIDNIEIPNINHFPTLAVSGGPLGLLNVDFIQDVNFYAGGFPVIYGDKLSSVMDITFREGNRRDFDVQLDLNFAGFGTVAEGPLWKNKGSFLFSARRSYLDMVVKTINVGTSVAPRYSDYQWKLAYDLYPSHKLSFIGIWGDDHNAPDLDTALENDMDYYGRQDIYERTTGFNWRAIWGKSGYSNTALSLTETIFDENWIETSTNDPMVKNKTRESGYKFRNMNHFKFHSRHSLDIGLDVKFLNMNYDNLYSSYTDAIGNPLSPIQLKNKIATAKAGSFLNYIVQPFLRLKTTFGIRTDYSFYNKNFLPAPRFSISYQMDKLTFLNASGGIYYQNLPLVILATSEEFKKLKDPRAIHYVLGIERLLTEDTRLTLELYTKEYSFLPLDPIQPSLFFVDAMYYFNNFFMNHGYLVDNGKAQSKGIEIIVQKKLAKDLYGLASASLFRSRYQGYDRVWRDRVYDNRYIFSFEGGYKPNNKWEFSARWILAGGSPYTPFDLASSKALHRAVLDKNKINGRRYPDYHSLNLRFDRRFNFSSTNLIFYLSVWNAYNHKNIASYFWNDKEQ